MIELVSTFPINTKWLADHPEGSNAFDIETAATLYTIYQMLHDIFESWTRPAAAMSSIILTRLTTVTPVLSSTPSTRISAHLRKLHHPKCSPLNLAPAETPRRQGKANNAPCERRSKVALHVPSKANTNPHICNDICA